MSSKKKIDSPVWRVGKEYTHAKVNKVRYRCLFVNDGCVLLQPIYDRGHDAGPGSGIPFVVLKEYVGYYSPAPERIELYGTFSPDRCRVDLTTVYSDIHNLKLTFEGAQLISAEVLKGIW